MFRFKDKNLGICRMIEKGKKQMTIALITKSVVSFQHLILKICLLYMHLARSPTIKKTYV
jgi:hypothetical protein